MIKTTRKCLCLWMTLFTKVTFFSLSFPLLTVVFGRSANPTITLTRTVATLWKHRCWSEWQFGAGMMPPAPCTGPSSVRRRWVLEPALPYHTETESALLWSTEKNQWSKVTSQSVVSCVYEQLFFLCFTKTPRTEKADLLQV